MNMMKKNGGFTLVELIVVIAILAILAGVAVPAYSGYIKKAQDAAVVVELDAISTAAQAANATGATAITAISVTESGITVTGESADNFATDFVMFYTNAEAASSGTVDFTFKTAPELDGTSYASGANWSSAGWVAATGSGN